MRIPASKITVPELPPGFARREHLLDRLDRATPERLVAVIAPPGYGKTILLADWLRRSGGRRTAWVCVDPTDDVVRFRATLLAAIAAIPALPPNSPLRAIGKAGDGAGMAPDFVDELGAALDATRPAIRVVLDDVHDLAAPEALRDLARLVRRRPAGLQLVLSSRADPQLPLPRLRLEGRLHELRADALRFSVAETAALLEASGLEVTAEQVAVLQERTDGWVAGLRFAELALRSTADPAGFIAQFSGSDSSVADYLTGEVMASLPVQTQWLLRVGAVCADLPVGLAATLFGRPDAAKVLDELAHSTALVHRTEPGTFRIHPLFRTYLVTDLERHQPALHRRSHATAASWWLAADDPLHALRHAERAGDPALLPELLRRAGVRLIATGRLAAVRRALDAAATAVAADPWTALLAALAHQQAGAVPDATAALDHAARIWPANPRPALRAFRAGVELLVTGRQAVPGEPQGPVAPELDVLLQLGRVAAATGAIGSDPDDLRKRLDRAVSVARAHGLSCFEVRALSQLAVLEAVQSNYRAMATAARSAITAAAAQARHPAEWAAEASAVLAYHDLLVGEPASARTRAADVLGAGRPLPEVAELILRVVHRAADADLGERVPDPPDLAGSAAEPAVTAAPAPLLAVIAALDHPVTLAQCGPAAAAGTAAWLERRVGKVGELLVMDARMNLRAGRYEAADAAVEPLRAGSVPALLAHTRVEAHLVAAEAALRAGDLGGGRVELAAALALGAALDIVRPFALVAAVSGDLLASVAPPGVGAGFLRRVMAARSVVRAEEPVCLSERELAVLAMLPSLLSAAEIADELTVSVNTVKSHIRSIYGKLGVSSRRDAVGRAHQRSLLR